MEPFQTYNLSFFTHSSPSSRRLQPEQEDVHIRGAEKVLKSEKKLIYTSTSQKTATVKVADCDDRSVEMETLECAHEHMSKHKKSQLEKKNSRNKGNGHQELKNDHEDEHHKLVIDLKIPLHLWACERFRVLSPCEAANNNYKAKNGDHLVGKWEGLKCKKMKLEEVRLVVKLDVNFEYICFGGFNVENEMLGFNLVGIDCVEKYFPHRVRKQFGVGEEKLNDQVMINDDEDLDSIDDEDIMFSSERLRVNKIMQQKSLLNCDDDDDKFSSFSVQNQSQTSAPSSEELEAPAAKEIFEEHLSSVVELKCRVSRLERGIAGIKARLKAALVMKKRM
ncbi:hypothetical protein Scep_016541 [Stephania cephalantha]|uniref:Aminotransferase-like plant mobile domain-containing protein n=1 Tax=Stephania cephalantha TaxID=152367 RepID=A0AAP0NTC2_9MAGN